MKLPALSEAELAQKVVSWLQADSWDVHQEVDVSRVRAIHHDGRADIVAVKDSRVRVVEVKKHLSFELIYQGRRWVGFAHDVYLAIPFSKRTTGRDFACEVAKQNGIGVLQVTQLFPHEESWGKPVKVLSEGPVREHINSALFEALRPEHKTAAVAGTNRGGHHTAFKATCAALRAHAEAFPGTTLRSALQLLDHHYSSVSSGVHSLIQWWEAGKVPGVDLRTVDGHVCVFPGSATAEGETPLEAKRRRKAERRASLKRVANP